MTSVTLYTLTTFSLRVAVHLRSQGLPRPGSVLLSQAEPGTSLRRRPDRAWLSALLEDGADHRETKEGDDQDRSAAHRGAARGDLPDEPAGAAEVPARPQAAAAATTQQAMTTSRNRNRNRRRTELISC